ncbi:tetratricopeptide repeat protein [Candidatus Pandoraea novymonadis]|uniref:tetratricopeptide repeat protein n=1 Tax=Candidatus Pandoraea novymonadis TaxID=1808959 RepID=UPI001FE5CA32|nr:tetratricopeptide repeat protein [Candidatus Pandoraea novymonadis]
MFTAIISIIVATIITGALIIPVHAQVLNNMVSTQKLQTPQQKSESEINQHIKAHHYSDALRAANVHVKKYPRDAQVLLTRGLILMELKFHQEAIDVFVALTQDFPELPEPYNNLAAAYAYQGAFDKARDALETAIRVHPNFAVAYENLGDVYVKLAYKAYLRAQQIFPSTTICNKAEQIDRMLLKKEIRGQQQPSNNTGAIPKKFLRSSKLCN